MNRAGFVSIFVLAFAASACASGEGDVAPGFDETTQTECPTLECLDGTATRDVNGDPTDLGNHPGAGGSANTGGGTSDVGTGGGDNGAGGSSNGNGGSSSTSSGGSGGATGGAANTDPPAAGGSDSGTGGKGSGGLIVIGGTGGASTGGRPGETEGDGCLKSSSLSSLVHVSANGDVLIGISVPGLPVVALEVNLCSLVEISGGVMVSGDAKLVIAGRKIALADVDLTLLYGKTGGYMDMSGHALVSLSDLTNGLVPPSIGKVEVNLGSLRDALCPHDDAHPPAAATCLVTSLVDQQVFPLLGTVATLTEDAQLVLDALTGTTKLVNVDANPSVKALLSTDAATVCKLPFLLKFADATIPATADVLNGTLVPGTSAVPGIVPLVGNTAAIARVTADPVHGTTITVDGGFLLDTGSLPAGLGLLASLPIAHATVTTNSAGVQVTGKVTAGTALAKVLGIGADADVVVTLGCDGVIASISLTGKLALLGVPVPLGSAVLITKAGIVIK